MYRFTVPLTVLALAATITACSSTDNGSGQIDPTGAHRSAAAASNRAPATSGKAARLPLDAAKFVRIVVSASAKAQTVTLKETSSLLDTPVTTHGYLRFRANATDANISTSVAGHQVQIIAVTGTVYLKGIEPGAPGKPWVKQSAAESGETTTLLDNADPRHTLQVLSAAGPLTAVGQETIDGVDATHYSATVDLAQLAKQVPELADDLHDAISAGAKTEDVQVWVDGQNRPVRERTTSKLPDPRDPTKLVTATQTVDFSAWGQPVSISAPPADQVTVK